MTTWSEYSTRTRSTKIAIAHIFPKQRWKEWTIVSGNIYKTTAPHIVEAVAIGMTALTADTSEAVALNKFYYKPETKELFINVGLDPITVNAILTYRLCFSSAPVNLPYDMIAGFDTEYEPRLKDLGDIKLELDFENQGIALETNSSVSLENTDGYFDDKFDVLIFENQRAIFYSYGLEIAPAESRIIFDGFMETKSFTPSDVKLTLKDQFKKLRDRMQMDLFTTADGNLTDSNLNKPKRRLYGKFDHLETVGIDKILTGYSLSGSHSIDQLGTTLNGTGTAYLDELSPEDELIITIEGEEYRYTVDTVDSNTLATLSDVSEVPFSGAVFVSPKVPWRKRNREWHIAGHKLREVSTTVSEFITPTRIRLTDTTDVTPGDLALVDGTDYVTIVRVSGDQVVLDQALSTNLVGGESFTILPVSSAYQDDRAFEQGRDYTVLNTATDAVVVLEDLAEFNITGQKLTPATFVFTNGSRNVTCSTVGLDLKTILQTRDWLRADSITRPEWYEILQVDETSLVLRTAFTASSFTGTAIRKNMNYIGDETLITVDCRGVEVAGEWKYSAARAVKHILETDLGSANINTATFTQAHEDAPQYLSYAIPEKPGSEAPVIRDTIAKINQSVLAAIYQDPNFDFAMTLLQSDKPEDLETLSDDDVLSFSVNTKQSIANLVSLSYRPFVDVLTGKDVFKLQEVDNDFVNETSQIQNTHVAKAYIYDDAAAETHAQRLGFIKSVTNTLITVKGKIDLVRFGIGDRIGLAFDRMFTRYGNESNQRVGIVYGVQSDEASASISLNDYNGVFTRVPAIAPDDAADYSSASDSDKSKWGYVCDNDSETPDGISNASLGNNLIG